MEKAIQMLKNMLSWSDRIGSDEIDEIANIIGVLKLEGKKYSESDLQKAFIAGGKLSRNINNPSFEEFLETLKTEENG